MPDNFAVALDIEEMSKLMMALGAALSVTPLLLPEPAASQRGLERQLAAATSVDCRFAALATGTWDDGIPSIAVSDAELTTSFIGIDVEEGTAEADSEFGSSLIIVRYASGYLHLMQLGTAGPLHLTTVLARETMDGRFMAVHTRHEYTPTIMPGFTSRPEMYIGDCEVKS